MDGWFYLCWLFGLDGWLVFVAYTRLNAIAVVLFWAVCFW